MSENIQGVAGPADGLRSWLLGSAVPLWMSAGADFEGGGFREALNPDGTPCDVSRRIRVQARQIYSVLLAGELSGGVRDSELRAADHGLGYLASTYLRADGLYRTLVTRDGLMQDDSALLYDQAFVLLALAAAARFIPEDRMLRTDQALALLEQMRATYTHSEGGYREASADRPFQSNALMHLFEAALSWTQISEASLWKDLANELGGHCCDRLIDPDSGVLREVYDQHWFPATGELGRIVDPGHQFEWAWLLEQWSWLSGRHDAPLKARRLFEIGEAGVDPSSGAVRDSLFDDLTARETTARLWPQTERLKAAHILGEDRASAQANGVLDRYLATNLRGLWRDRLNPDGGFEDGPAPASSLYHIVTAIAEIHDIRIVRVRRQLETTRPGW